MRVVAHPDPVVLEAELLRRVGEAQAGDPLAPVLVLVPTRRLAHHVDRRLAQAAGARLAVEVTHPRALALRLLEEAGHPVRPASPLLLLALLDDVLRRLPANLWARFLASRPGARRSLLATLQELREAGLRPEQLREAAGSGPEETALAEIYDAYARRLEARAGAGLADEASLLAAALPLAASRAGGYAAILQHGAYELTGMHLELLRVLDRAREVTFLLPWAPDAPAYRTAAHFARQFLLEAGGEVEAPAAAATAAGSLLGARLPILYKEDDVHGPGELRPGEAAPAGPGTAPAVPTPLPAGPSWTQGLPDAALAFFSAQGARAETQAAVLHALAAVGAGTPPAEVAFVARQLAPYQLAMEGEMEDRDLPWQTSAGFPLRRELLVGDLLRLLAVVRDDFPRAATAAWAASPRVNWPELVAGPAPPAAKADDWSRQAGILGGLEEWTQDLPAWAGTPQVRDDASNARRAKAREDARRREADCRRLATGLAALAARCEAGRARRWREHAALLRGLLDDVLPAPSGEPPAAREHLWTILDEMDRLETVLGHSAPVSFPAMVAWLEEAVDQTTLAGRDSGGFAVLDAMQARGLTCRRLHLLGWQAGLFPRVPREDPFLSDAARQRLRAAHGVPLSLKLAGDDEERLLLALLLGSATESLHISWQRSDAQGRSRMPSLALREVARAAYGVPELEAVEARSRRLPAHPSQLLEALAEATSLLPPDAAPLLTALRSDGPEAALAALQSAGRPLPPLTRQGLELLAQVEAFAGDTPTCDGRVGPGRHLPDSVSVMAVETLGRCPLQFFFGHVLRVRELEDETSAEEFAGQELGTRIHALLESVLRRLHEEGALGGTARELASRTAALLDEEWNRLLVAAAARRAARLPVLWDLVLKSWRAAVASFLDEELPRLAGLRPAALHLETPRERPISREGRTLTVRGRLDRLVERGQGPALVSDYKTSGRLQDALNPTEMLRGHRLQVPLYRWLLEGAAAVELLGVGPAYEAGGPLAEHRRPVPFDGFATAAMEQGFLETLETLCSLLAAGRFPLRAGNHCSWCDFRLACRRHHPPTLEREAAAADTAAYRALQDKTRKAPLLADVHGEEAS